ncbi:MAG: hypothetical protein A3I72_03315 [Candidatus Tectomicrobia bacterium RIFCSPLOWO2_02_FULL_70_19]|nr:MAG: hypothetical protein A3I72_03315 [Candidatus Tectomicrobia bacterium RIFCSPLOWO2_02_FULL_70_19]
MVERVTILGGGPAGLAAGYYLRKAGFGVEVLEAAGEVGGNCRTVEIDGFRFDTGAHRFHDKDPEITQEVRRLIGEGGLHEVEVPSRILSERSYYHFPIRPKDILLSAGAGKALRVAVDLARRALRPRGGPPRSFEEFARATYGDWLAERFLLPYTSKLWGLPCGALSAEVGTARLGGLRPFDLIREFFLSDEKNSRHFDGLFLYPAEGYGDIPLALARAIGPASIRLNSRVEGIEAEGGRLTAFRLAGGRREVLAGPVLCTLPLPLVARMLAGCLSAGARAAAARIRYRSLRLLFLALRRTSVSPDASIYFPDPNVPFTRIHEPRNRSRRMAPAGMTSLVVEFPFFAGEAVGEAPAGELAETALTLLERWGLARRAELLFARSLSLPAAYPVMEIGYQEGRDRVLGEVSKIRNLKILGRGGRFAYAHLHDMMREGLAAAEEIQGERNRPSGG